MDSDIRPWISISINIPLGFNCSTWAVEVVTNMDDYIGQKFVKTTFRDFFFLRQVLFFGYMAKTAGKWPYQQQARN